MDRRICVIGGGRWGRNHIRTLAELGCLGGIVEPDADTRNQLAESYPEVEIFGDMAPALAANFHGYTVATPAEAHYEIAKAVILNGCPVLVEKPIALTSAHARELKELAHEHGVNLMVGHLLLFHPAMRKIDELIKSGKVGKLQYLYSNRLNLGTVRTEENILWSFAPHDISIFQEFIGSMPTEVVSRGGAFLQSHLQDSTMTVLTYPDNIVGHIFVSWLHPFKEHRLVVIGSKGMLSYEDSSTEKQILFYEKGIDWVRGEPIKRDGPTEIIPYQHSLPLTDELRYFVERLDGRPIEVADGQNAQDVLEILEQASDSLAVHEKPAPSTTTQSSVRIHPSSYVDEGVEIGEGSRIWHYCHVQANSRIGRNCSLGQNVNVGNNVIIGDHVKIQNNVSIYEGVELEDYVFCGPSMVFTNVLDPRSKYPQRGSGFYRKTLVREGATIGANATIVCGNTIGRHAFIGAGALVAHDVPDYALMLGVPAVQKGWVCECAQALPEFSEEVACPKCSRRYALRSGELEQLGSHDEEPAGDV